MQLKTVLTIAEINVWKDTMFEKDKGRLMSTTPNTENREEVAVAGR